MQPSLAFLSLSQQSAYDNRVTFTIRGQDEAGNVNKEVIVYIGIHAADELKPSLTVLGSLLQFNEKDDDATIAFDDNVPSSKLLNFDSTATFTAGTGQKFAAVYAYLTRPEPNEEKTVGVSCCKPSHSTGRLSLSIMASQRLCLVRNASAGYPYTDDYCRWEELKLSLISQTLEHKFLSIQSIRLQEKKTADGKGEFKLVTTFTDSSASYSAPTNR
jgi:hypothetical protein